MIPMLSPSPTNRFERANKDVAIAPLVVILDLSLLTRSPTVIEITIINIAVVLVL